MSTEEQTAEKKVDNIAESVQAAEGENKTSELSDRQAEGQRFLDAFGEERGSLYFTKGFSFADATVAYTTALQEEVTELRNKVAAMKASGEESPVDFSAGEDSAPQPIIRIRK